MQLSCPTAPQTQSPEYQELRSDTLAPTLPKGGVPYDGQSNNTSILASESKENPMSQLTNTTLDVQGMSCQHCVMAVTKATTALAGVENTDVALETGKVTVNYDPSIVSLETIKAAITEEGFTVAA
jgi:copper ion binding protein